MTKQKELLNSDKEVKPPDDFSSRPPALNPLDPVKNINPSDYSLGPIGGDFIYGVFYYDGKEFYCKTEVIYSCRPWPPAAASNSTPKKD